MNHITSIARTSKNFVIRHRTSILCTATALVALQVGKNERVALMQFIEEHDLMSEYTGFAIEG